MADRGRPRRFDRSAALRAAMVVFWRRGFEGASLSALTEAMGINSPSLYACFGSKEALFQAAVDLYVATIGEETRAALENPPTARAGIEAMLRANVARYSSRTCPAGCLVVLGDRNAADEHDAIHAFLARHRRDSQTMIARRLTRAVEAGEIPSGIDAEAIAGFYATLVFGLALQSRDGVSAAAMDRVVDGAMAAWEPLTGALRRSA